MNGWPRLGELDTGREGSLSKWFTAIGQKYVFGFVPRQINPFTDFSPIGSMNDLGRQSIHAFLPYVRMKCFSLLRRQSILPCEPKANRNSICVVLPPTISDCAFYLSFL